MGGARGDEPEGNKRKTLTSTSNGPFKTITPCSSFLVINNNKTAR